MKWWHFISRRLNLHGDIMFYRKKTLAIIWPIDSGMISFNTGRIIKWRKCIQGNESFFRMVLAGEVSLPLMRVSQKSSACLIRVSFLAENNQRAAPSERLRRLFCLSVKSAPVFCAWSIFVLHCVTLDYNSFFIVAPGLRGWSWLTFYMFLVVSVTIKTDGCFMHILSKRTPSFVCILYFPVQTRLWTQRNDSMRWSTFNKPPETPVVLVDRSHLFENLLKRIGQLGCSFISLTGRKA